eukprot:EG_transcript_16087
MQSANLKDKKTLVLRPFPPNPIHSINSSICIQSIHCIHSSTDGSIQQAVDACNAATRPHSFLSVTKQGLAAIVHTNGNPDFFVMLTGGDSGPNYSAEKVAEAR